MPRWYKNLGNIDKQLRVNAYGLLKVRGYSPAVARRIRDWGCLRFHQALIRFNPRIKASSSEGTTFWREYNKQE